MPTRTIFAVAATTFGLNLTPMSASPAQAPWFGSWKLNLAKSTANPDRYKTVTSKIEPWEDGLKVTYDMVGTRGGVIHMEWNGRFDGKDYTVQGVDYVLNFLPAELELLEANHIPA
ncbi:MAG: hypothetical protein HYU27_06770 [Acidobacteria bacterium]|nr:hypothetical protein [Acidobacteriota bacterium]